jgi:hypothetical protein
MDTPASATADAGASTSSDDQARLEERRAQRLAALGDILAKSRSEAIAARIALGIDEQWAEDLEFYEGVDDANRGEVTSSWRSKPPGQAIPASNKDDGEVRSTVFVNITRPYCDAAAARISDMLMPTDDRAFSVGPTPIPDMEDIAVGKVSLAVRKSIADQSQSLEQANTALQAYVQDAQARMEDAKARAKKAQTRFGTTTAPWSAMT